MKKILLCLLLSGVASAQSLTTTYTGTIKDLSGAVATSGQVTFTLSPSTDSTISGSARFTPSTITCNITTGGAIQSLAGGACVVTKNTALSPGGTSYRICIQPYFVTPGSCFFDYATTDTKDISTVAPTLPTGPINYGGVPGPVGPLGPVGPQGIAGSVSACGAAGTLQTTNGSGVLQCADASTLLNGIPLQAYTNTAHPPLAYWDAALHNCRNQVVSANIYGDSRSIQAAADVVFGGGGGNQTVPSSWAGRWVSRLDAQLKRMCGSHGSGIQPLRWGTGTFNAQGLNEYMYSYVDGVAGWTPSDTSLGPYQGSDSMVVKSLVDNATLGYYPQVPDGSGGFFASTGSIPAPLSTLSYDHLRVYYVRGTGFNPLTITIDGLIVATCASGSGAETAALCTSLAVPLGRHSAFVTCPTHPCGIYAMQAVAGTTGAEINNFSIGSASLEALSGALSQYAFENLDPDVAQLHIINHVTNEINQGVSLGTFQASLANAVTHASSRSPNPASILFVANTIDSLTVAEPIGPYYDAIRSTARSNNAALADLRDRWGPTPPPPFFFGDVALAHESNIGNGEIYSMVAATVIDVPLAPAIFANCTGSYMIAADSFGGFSCADPVPVEVWPMNEGSGSTFNNPINTSHTATATGVTWSPQVGFVGTGIVATFAGGTATAVANTTSASFAANKPFTVCAWLSPSNLTPALSEFYSVFSTVNGGFDFYISSSGMLDAFLTDTAGTPMGVQSAAGTIAVGSVHHVCAVYTGTQTVSGLSLYLDGVPLPTNSSGSSIASITTGTPVSFGLNSSHTSFPFSGRMAYTRVYGSALGITVIANLYAKGQQ